MPDQPSQAYPHRGTYYFSEEQLLELDVIMLKLRTEHGLRKAGKSELMRLAHTLLVATPIADIAEALKKEGAC